MVKAEYSLRDAQRDLQAEGSESVLPIANRLASALYRVGSAGVASTLFALYGSEAGRPEGITERYEAIEQRFRRDLSRTGFTPVAWFRDSLPAVEGVDSIMEGFGMIKPTSLRYHVGVRTTDQSILDKQLISGGASLVFDKEHFSPRGRGGIVTGLTGMWRTVEAFDDGRDWSLVNRYVVGLDAITTRVEAIGGRDDGVERAHRNLEFALRRFDLVAKV